MDPQKAKLEVANYDQAVYAFSVTALRNILGQHVLDENLTEREGINKTLQKMVNSASENLGIKIEMVDMKDVEIPNTLQRAMAREAEEIREKEQE